MAATAGVAIGCLAPVALAFLVKDRFSLTVLALAALQAIYAASWVLLSGLTGRVSLGHALPYGCGAYATALLAVWFHMPPAGAVAGGVVAGALAGALQGVVGARLSPTFLALVTLAMAEGIHELSPMLPVVGPGGVIFGGEAGIPAPAFPMSEAGAARLAAIVLALGLAGLLMLARSPLGLAMRSVRADAPSASASGIDAGRVQVVAFVLAAAGAGLAGGLMVGMVGRASPPMLSLGQSLFAVAAATLGGMGAGLGAAAVAYVSTIGLQWLEVTGPLRLTGYALVIIGAGLIAPGGALRFPLRPGARIERPRSWRADHA